MENNEIVKYEGGLLQIVSNAIGITNKLLNIDFRKIHAVHFDDHQIFLRGVALSLKPIMPNLHIEGFTNGKEALNYVKNCYKKNEKLDIIISGINQKDIDGFDFAKNIRDIEKKYNKITPIIIISMYVSDPLWPKIKKALDDGLWNMVLPKFVSPEKISECIKSFINNPNEIIQYEGDSNLDSISIGQREKELLTLLDKKYTAQEISQKMGLRVSTVETIKCRLMERFGVKSSEALIFYARENSLID